MYNAKVKNIIQEMLMKKKQSLIIITLIILILITLAGILAIIIKSESTKNINSDKTSTGQNNGVDSENETSMQLDTQIEVNSDINYEVSKDNYMVYPKNIQDIFTISRVGIIAESDFAKTVFNFVYDSVEKIYEETKDKSDDEILSYYKINQIEIEEYHIFNEEDFYSIAKEIKNIKANNENAKYSSCEIDTTTKKETDEALTFDMLITFSNSKSMNVKVYLSKTIHKIAFQKEFGLEDIFKKYTGDIDEASLRKFMYTFENSSIGIINNLAKEKSYNAILQQYDNKKEQINSYGIYDANDYLDIANQIIQVRWSKGATLKNYTVDENSLANNGKYTSFNVTLNYTTGNTVKIKLGIANSKDQTPQFVVAKA